MIFKAIKKIVLEVMDEEEERITLGANIVRDLGWDHVDMMDLIFEMETVFDITIPDEDVEEFETIADIVNYVENH